MTEAKDARVNNERHKTNLLGRSARNHDGDARVQAQ